MTEPADTPPPLAVQLNHGQIMAAALASQSRNRGSGIWFALVLFGLLCLAVWLGHLASFALVQRLPFAVMVALGPYLPIVAPALFALIGVTWAMQFEQWRAGRAFLASMAARGVPLDREGTFTVTEDALVLDTARTSISTRWATIDTLERHIYGWTISADQLHSLIPFAAFGDDDAAQRRFLAAITSRMTPEARARSRDAVDYASGGAAHPAPTARRPGPWSAAVAKGAATLPQSGEPLSGVPEASAWLTQEQAGWAAAIVQDKAARLSFHHWAYPLTGMITAMLVAATTFAAILFVLPWEQLVSQHPVAFVMAGFAVPALAALAGLWLANQRLSIVAGKAWAGALAARGVPDQNEVRWTLTDTGITYQSARFAAEASYASVHQVLHEGPYWIVACDALTLCIPDTAFADAEAARTFMAALLARIADPARARSVTLG